MRRNAAKKRQILPDPIQKSRLLAKFINNLMKSGKKSVAERIVYKSLETALKRLLEKKDSTLEWLHGKTTVDELLEAVLNKVRPTVEVKSRRIGGATYQIPCEVRPERSIALAMRWLIGAARKRSEKGMISRLAAEICDVFGGRGAALKTKLDKHRMAEANKAFAHIN